MQNKNKQTTKILKLKNKLNFIFICNILDKIVFIIINNFIFSFFYLIQDNNNLEINRMY
jgi:hypothetical protein